MSEAFKLKVPKESYQQTVNELNGELERLEVQKIKMRTILSRLQGETFSGSDVQSTIDVAKETLDRVEKAYVKIKSQRDTIQEYLNSTETDASTLQTNVSHIQDELPDLFK